VWSTSSHRKALSWFMEFVRENEVYGAPASYFHDQWGDKSNEVALSTQQGASWAFPTRNTTSANAC